MTGLASYPTVTLEAAFGIDPTGTYGVFDDASRGKFNTMKFGPDAGIWTDLSSRLRSWEIDRGKNRATDQYKAGRGTAELDNRDGNLDPDNASGLYVSGGVTQVAPMRRVRWRAAWAGITYDLAQFLADDWAVEYRGTKDAVTNLAATDIFKILANFNALASTPVGASELTGARINRILDNVGIAAGDRAIDAGRATVQATTLAQNARTEFDLTVDSEGGDGYVDELGKITFKRINAWLEDTRSVTSQATFGDLYPPDPTVELPYIRLGRAANADQVGNRFSYARIGGATQVVEDLTSEARYEVKPKVRTDLIRETDPDALYLATRDLYLYKDFEQRLDTMVLKPALYGTQMWPVVLGLKFGDRLTIKLRTPDGRTMTRDCFVIGIKHTVRPGSWIVTLQLASATLLTGFLIFDHATLGKCNTGTFAP